MTSQPSIGTPGFGETRPLQTTAIELAALGVLSCVYAAFVLDLDFYKDPQRLYSKAIEAGDLLFVHLGWLVGMAITVLLALYVLVIGGQLSGRSSEMWRIRRQLGWLAEVVAAMVTPALVLTALTCLTRPELRGGLLLVIPAALAIYLLAIPLGGLVLFDNEHLYQEAIEERAKLQTKLDGPLRRRSNQHVLAVVYANAAPGWLIGNLVFSIEGQEISWLRLIVSAEELVLLSFLVVIFRAVGLSQGVMFDGLVVCMLGVLGVSALVDAIDSGYTAYLLGCILIFVSAFWPRRSSNQFTRFCQDWSLRAAAAEVGSKAVRWKLGRVEKTIKDIEAAESVSDPK